MSELDSQDTALLRALQRNARRSVASLAREIGRSRSATHDRLNRLEKNGTIQGYSAMLRTGATSAGVAAVLAVRFEAGVHHQSLVNRLMALPRFRSGRCVSGDLDMLLDVDCESLNELNVLRDQVSGHKGVLQVVTYPVLQNHRSK